MGRIDKSQNRTYFSIGKCKFSLSSVKISGSALTFLNHFDFIITRVPEYIQLRSRSKKCFIQALHILLVVQLRFFSSFCPHLFYVFSYNINQGQHLFSIIIGFNEYTTLDSDFDSLYCVGCVNLLVSPFRVICKTNHGKDLSEVIYLTRSIFINIILCTPLFDYCY